MTKETRRQKNSGFLAPSGVQEGEALCKATIDYAILSIDEENGCVGHFRSGNLQVGGGGEALNFFLVGMCCVGFQK